MSEEKTPVVSGEEVVNDSYDYISAINEMKKNTVSREAYEKLINERNALADAVINGTAAPVVETKPAPNIDALRNKLFSPQSRDDGMTSMEFIDTALQLRDAILDTEGKDIFMPEGRGVVVTAEDREQAETAARIYRECLDYAQGDATIFRNELMRRTVDTSTVTAKGRNNPYYRR